MSVLMRATIFFIFHFLVLRISIDLLDSDRRPVLLLLLAVSDQVIGYRLCVMRSKFYIIMVYARPWQYRFAKTHN